MTVTFLFTDVEGGTRLWKSNPALVGSALARHEQLIERLVEQHEGTAVRPRGEGDSRLALFQRASDAVAAACAIQRAFLDEPWPTPLWVRMAMHSGESDIRNSDYYGTVVNRCARLRDIAHGGQTLVSGVTADLVRDALPPSIRLRDLGSHRLKDLTAPEHVFQLVQPDLPSEFPPLNSLSALHHNLPIQLTSFVGREREMDEVLYLIRTARLLTVTGAAGSGKTRLSLQIAAEFIDNYPDGVWFVDLAPVTEPALVVQSVSSEMGVQASLDDNLHTRLLQTLAEKNLLIVLDNCEHVLAACAQLTANLLRRCEHVSVIATSREPLGVPGETVWRIPSLSLPPDPRTRPSLADVEGADAVRLFVERARTARPFFVLSPESAPSISQICRALDGIPLGIELAAPWVGVISVDQIAARLNSALRILNTGGRARPFRHQTIRAAIGWSYALLAAAERTFFQRLSVFVGGWSLEAAEEVVAGDGIEKTDALDLLRSLVDKSLVVTQPRPDGSMRYRLLEILRQYAQERLEESGTAETVRSKHAEYFVVLGEQAEPNLKGGPQVKSWLDRLDEEEGNLRAVLRWCSERVHTDQGIRLGGAVWQYWHLHGSLEEGRNWLNLLLGMAGSANPRDGRRAKVLNGAGVLAIDQEDFATAQRLLDESCAIGRELGDHARVAACLHNLGVVAWSGHGDYAKAERLYAESLNIARNHGMRAVEASDLHVLGLLFAEKGDSQRARDLSTECVGVFRELGDELNALLSQLNLAWVSLQEGDLVGARELYAYVLSRLKDNHPADGILECLEGLAAVAAREGGVERAIQLASACAHLRQVVGRPPNRLQRKRIDSWFHLVHGAIAQGTGLAARCEGETMSLAGAIEYALSDIGSTFSTSQVGVSNKTFASGALTRREQEVAAFLAKGRSNRQIAETLVIANSTAERHVANILSKLGLSSRLEVGLWAAQNGLT